MTATEAALRAEALRRHEPSPAWADKGVAVGGLRLPWKAAQWRSISRVCDLRAGWIDGHAASFLDQGPAIATEMRVARNTPGYLDEKGT